MSSLLYNIYSLLSVDLVIFLGYGWCKGLSPCATHVLENIATPIVLMMAAGRDSGRDRLEDLEDRLESFIESLRAVGVIAGDFQQNGQSVLNERVLVMNIICTLWICIILFV